MTRNAESGQALVLTALALAVILGVTGLAIDMGVMRYQKRIEQSAADAAAIAGAQNLKYDGAGSTGVISGAQNASAADGFTSASGVTCPSSTSGLPTDLAVGTVDVTVCNPPIAGPHAGDSDYVETYVSAGQPTYFMKIFGVDSETITARAVATNLGGGADSGCVYTLGPPNASIEGVNINGSVTLYAPSCGIVDNGDYNTKGNKLIVTVDSFGMSGNQESTLGTTTCIATPNSCPTMGMPASADPLGYLTPPCTSCSGGNTINISGTSDTACGTGCTYDSSNSTYYISPGTYCSITITGTATENVVFDSGLYIIDGMGSGCTTESLNISGNPNISGTGVTFFFTNSSTLNMTGTPLITLSAPTSGTYQGVLFYQDPTDTNTNGPSLGGNTGSNFTGVIYFPNDQFTMYGNNVSYDVGMVICYSLNFSGNPDVTVDGPGGIPGGDPLKNAILVE
jgi:hypothetical protein